MTQFFGRLAAVWASACIGWHELQEVLQNISETDLDKLQDTMFSAKD